jgi:DegV family protein with EDD domain
MSEEYPERTIEIVDSLNASIGQGLVLREMLRMRDAGFSLTEIAEKGREVVKTTRTLFTLDSLEYLKKGGRIGPTQAFVGGILGLRPILQVVEGEIVSLENVRGKKRVLNMLASAVVDVLKDTKNDANIAVGEIMGMDDAVKFQQGIENALEVKIENPVTSVGVTIGTHTGPGAMAISYCRKYEAI